MSKTVVIYESIYGSTEKYAKWISEELKCDLFSSKDITIDKLKDYDTIIYGGGLYAGSISGIKLITKNYKTIKDKKIVIFTVGLADPTNPANSLNLNRTIDSSFTEEMKNNISIFHLRGGVDYSKLSMAHKLMMGMLKRMLMKKNESNISAEDKEFLNTYGKNTDYTDKATIKPIIDMLTK